MRAGRLLLLLIIVMASIGLGFPDASRLLPIPAMAADIEVGSAGELEAVMTSAISEVRESVKVGIAGYDEKSYDINRIFNNVLEKNADLGFVAGCSTSITKTFGKSDAMLELRLQYLYPPEKVSAMRSETDRKADEIVRSIIKPGMSEYEKVLAVHDHLIRNSVYDRTNADNASVPPEEHEAYGVIVNGTGVCDSYAKAVKLLLDKAGVECMFIEGTGAETPGKSADHAWNIVSIDGEYYHLDATWDDVSEERGSDATAYYYFNLSDTDVQNTHVWDRSRYPECRGTKYNYFVYNGLCADNYNEALSMLKKAVSEREKRLMLRIADYSASEYNIEDMIRKAAEKARLHNGIRAKWIINDSLGIIDIEFEY